MKSKVYILIALSLALMVTMAKGGAYVFSPASVLATGKWVKVETRQAGIYELSHTRLAEMGFSNPDKVSVYGSGGIQMPDRLVQNGRNSVHDDLRQIPVIHKNGKLYFYARGLREPVLGSSGFESNSLNIYSQTGHYFLTDSGPAMTLTEPNDVSSFMENAADRSKGYDWRIHEDDRMHGHYKYGNEFWECALSEGNTLTWNLPVSCMALQSECSTLSRIVYMQTKSGASYNMTMRLGNNNHPASYTGGSTGSSDLLGVPVLIRTNSFTLPKASSVSVGVSLNSSNTDLFYDWTLLTYTKDISMAGTDMVQERLYLRPAAQDTGNGYVRIPSGSIVLDVTDPFQPFALPANAGKAYFKESAVDRTLLAFNPSNSQLIPENPVNVANQNLHGLQHQKYEFLIVAVPEMLEYAEQIARLHRDHDKINVAVVTTEQIYNEFSSGNQDPVAVRMLVKLMYESQDNALKNVLLVGPVNSETRGIQVKSTYRYPIIGIQEGGIYSSREPAIVFDYYGNTSDNLLPTQLSGMTVQTGVGVLPIYTETDGERIVSKIKRYLTFIDSDDFAWYVNETITASCTGDDHLHNDQAARLGSNLQNYINTATGGRVRNNNFAQEFYSQNSQAPIYTDMLENGKLLSFYVGHAGQSSLSVFYSAPNFARLRNKLPFFMMFAGCDLTVPDYGGRHLGQQVVTDYDNALIGSFCSTRTAWASENFNLADYFTKALFKDRNNNPLARPRTIGEAYAQAKSSINGANKLVYIYVGDPALTIPLPTRSMECRLTGNLTAYRPGDVVTLSGSIAAKDGDAPFNGKAVLKICQPDQIRSSLTDPAYKLTFQADLISSVHVSVKDGVFTARIPLSGAVESFMSHDGAASSLNLYVGAYDPSQRLSAATLVKVPMMKKDEVRTEIPAPGQTDTQAPMVTAEYDAASMSLNVAVSDDVAVIPGVGGASGLSMRVDNNAITTEAVQSDDICGTADYETGYFVGHLADGEHTLTYSARDMAGNATETKTLRFTISRDNAATLLSTERSYGIDSMRFIPVAGTSGMQLIVMNSDGRIVFTEDNVEGPVDWDCSELPAGTYTATLRAPDHRTIRSNTVTFTLID